MITKHKMTFLNEPEIIFCTQLNHFTYFNQIQIILFNINHLFVHNYMVSSISIYYK